MTTNEWTSKRLMTLFGPERIEEWKDRIAQYWTKQVEDIDERQLRNAFTRMFGRKLARKYVRTTRDEQVKRLIQGEVAYVFAQAARKVALIVDDQTDKLAAEKLHLEDRPYSEADVSHEGKVYHVKVDGIICIAGTVYAYHRDGTWGQASLFPKWISHPFWQYQHHKGRFKKDENGKIVSVKKPALIGN